MPYRVKSTDVWFNLPGVVAAWQPVAAPGPFAARQNVSHDALRAGVYTATDGVAPTWHGATGWTFNGTTQYLSTLIIPTIDQTWSFLIRMDLTGTVVNKTVFFTRGGTNKDFGLFFFGDTQAYFYNGGTQNRTVSTIQADTVLGVSGNRSFQNGKPFATTISAGSPPTTQPLLIGCGNNSGTPSWFCAGSVSAVAVVSRTLSDAEMLRASRQMTYCHVNPDWSAWGRRRRYYYAEYVAPAVTADDIRSAAAGVGMFGTVLGRAARSGHQQAAALPAAPVSRHRSRLNSG